MAETQTKPENLPVPARQIPLRVIRARYDAAATTEDNRRHWVNADSLAADAANAPAIRSILRTRSRYEVANNSYALGLVSTVANDVVGVGPRLQLTTQDRALNQVVETEFGDWAEEIRLADKLRLMRAARIVSGEVFAMLVNNPGLDSPIKLDVRLYEADQVADPTFQGNLSPNWDDGIFFDQWGNPSSYRLLKYHPGSMGWGISFGEFDDIPARWMFHYFRADRPGQRRGIPEITPAVQLFAELRRYTAATIAAAETAAEYAAVVYTDAPASGESEPAEAFDLVELERRMATILPAGWKLGQMEAQQPTTGHDAFVRTKLAEISRCLNVPYTIAALDSSNANLSARYLDSQIYGRAVAIDRHQLSRLLNRVLDQWLTEALRIPRYLPELPVRIPHQWFWPQIDQHADPQKVAAAQAQRLKTGMTTIPREYAAMGLDWEDEFEAAARSLGMTVDEYREMVRWGIFNDPQQAQQQAAGQAAGQSNGGDDEEA